MDISFRLDPETVVGPDTITRIGAICKHYGNRALLATEQVLYEKKGIERLCGILEESGIETIVFDDISAQSMADVAESAATLARGACCSVIIGYGGLHTQAIARMTALIASTNVPVFDLLDGHESKTFVPYIAVPTAARDPFIFTNNFVAVDPRDRSVKLVKSPPRLCVAAVIDCKLSESFSGAFSPTDIFDGLCTALEAYCSSKGNYLSDAFLEEAISIYSRMITNFSEQDSLTLIEESTNAGYLVSLGSTVSAPGIGTALAYAINARFPVAKSWSATVLLPYIMEKLVPARPEKLARICSLMGEAAADEPVSDSANKIVEAVRRWMGATKAPARLKEFHLTLDKMMPVAESARNLEFVAFSPWTVSTEDAFDLLKQAF